VVPKDGFITRGGGTPSTWAPEVAKKGDKQIYLSADWWSVGTVIYQLMYQKSPCEKVLTDDGTDVEYPGQWWVF